MSTVLHVQLCNNEQNWRNRLRISVGPNTGALICLLVLVGSLVPQTGSPWLTCVAAALVALLASAALQTRPDRMELSLEGPQTLAAGEQAPYALHITNLGRHPTPASTLIIQMIGVTPVQRIIEPLRPGQTHLQAIELCAITRAAPQSATVQLVSTDPLHLINLNLRWEVPVNLLIHPMKVAAPGVSHESHGELPQQRQAPSVGQDLAGLRPYRRGDSRRAIHWRSTARRNELVVVERVHQVGMGQVVVVTGVPRTLNDELTIATAAAVATNAVQDGHQLAVLGWEGGTVSAAPIHHPRATLNWFSRTAFDFPTPAELAARLPHWTGNVAIAVPEHVPQPWRRQVEKDVVARGAEVTWLSPGRITTEQHALVSMAWEVAE